MRSSRSVRLTAVAFQGGQPGETCSLCCFCEVVRLVVTLNNISPIQGVYRVLFSGFAARVTIPLRKTFIDIYNDRRKNAVPDSDERPNSFINPPKYNYRVNPVANYLSKEIVARNRER